MPRPLRLKPRQVGKRWVLDVPAEISDTGSRHRPYFKTIEEARFKASELRARQHNLRIAGDDFPELLKADAWRAIETMRKCELPEAYQAKFLGENARKLYKIDAPKTFIRERVTEIERPEWWPRDEEVRGSLKPEAAVSRF